ncbi:unnamed protein product [Lupinus luteus]|uniref:Cellulose synthase-like protein H1 n=1 Tax=Lupinus luteus TaxID=3873 RepID=A0AAV1YIX5_LUPLU
MDVLILFLLLLLLCYRVTSVNNYSIPWFVALVCESWFTFSWIFIFTTQWTPAIVKTYPDRLLHSVQELPRVDLFVTTADDVLEPPIITVNTVLSLLALDYPAEKLACYVSDDGFSPLTFHALQQASHFAKLWIPFCKKYHVQIRAPFRFFCDQNGASSYQNTTPKFREEWLWMKEKYDNLCHKIEEASHKSIPWQLDGEFAVFSNSDRKNHPTIIRVIWDKNEGLFDGLPHLIYISREKRSNHPHHFKAGAMNVLYIGAGLAGLQGPFYGGTNCFHRRKVIYGLSPYNIEKGNIISEKELKQKFGGSEELVKSVADALEGRSYSPHDDINVSNTLEAASEVASCGYEYANGWGQQVGWIYGSITEDVQTGLTIHRKGWRSEMCTPNPIGFTGCAPIGLPTAMTQQKRWVTGMVEIFFSRHCPILATLFGNLPFRMFLAYMWIIDWGLRSLPQTCYVSLLTYCIITNSNFLPKGWGLWIHVTIFTIHTVCTLSEYLATGLSIRAWWNNQRMSRIRTTSAGFLGFLSALFKLLRISDTVFDITRKDENPFGNGIHDSDAGRFTFNESPVFVPATTILLSQLIALSMKLLGLQPIKSGNNECGIDCAKRDPEHHADTALLEAKKIASQYQKEADKCNSGMETCEEAREKAESAIVAQKKLTALWELRARRKGWEEWVAKSNTKSHGNVQYA